MQVEEIVFRMMGRNPGYAERWQEGLEQATVSLETFPRRCPLAHENESFPYEVRQLLYASHRILFTLLVPTRTAKTIPFAFSTSVIKRNAGSTMRKKNSLSTTNLIRCGKSRRSFRRF